MKTDRRYNYTLNVKIQMETLNVDTNYTLDVKIPMDYNYTLNVPKDGRFPDSIYGNGCGAEN